MPQFSGRTMPQSRTFCFLQPLHVASPPPTSLFCDKTALPSPSIFLMSAKALVRGFYGIFIWIDLCSEIWFMTAFMELNVMWMNYFIVNDWCNDVNICENFKRFIVGDFSNFQFVMSLTFHLMTWTMYMVPILHIVLSSCLFSSTKMK